MVGGGDVAVRADPSAAADALLRYLASPAAAAVWAARGGFVSPNLNLDLSVYPDAISRRVARDLLDAGDGFRFDLSDLQPAAFGGGEDAGMHARADGLPPAPGRGADRRPARGSGRRRVRRGGIAMTRPPARGRPSRPGKPGLAAAARPRRPVRLGRLPGDDVSRGPRPRARQSWSRSFAFPESDLLAEIYAQALMGAGVPVRRELDLGPRELVRRRCEQGLVDVVPEYLGTALARSPAAEPADAADVPAARRALDARTGPWRLRSLEPATASDQNGLVGDPCDGPRLDLAPRSATCRRRAPADLRDDAGVPDARVLPGRPAAGLRRAVPALLPLATEAQRAAALTENVADVASCSRRTAPSRR